MSDILEKVRNLLARTTSPFEEEARSSAYLAAKLILKHNIELSYPFGYRPPPPPPPASSGVPHTDGASARKEKRQARRKAPPKKPRSREELMQVAEQKCIRLMDFFQRKAQQGQFPVLSLPFLVRKSVEEGIISEAERPIFHLVFGEILRALVNQGVLLSKTGGKGGYWFVVQPEPEPVKPKRKGRKPRAEASP